MALIGINGKIGAGKDTVGMMIQALTGEGRWASDPIGYAKAYAGRPNLKGGYRIKKFAGPLKQIASILTGIPVARFEDQEFKMSSLGPEWGGMTVRSFLQLLGTEAIRGGIHDNAWLNATFVDYEPSSNWIITDMRFPNEMDAIKVRGGATILVVRPSERAQEDGAIPHSSETALDGATFDYTIVNNGTLQQLLYKVIAVLADLKILP